MKTVFQPIMHIFTIHLGFALLGSPNACYVIRWLDLKAITTIIWCINLPFWPVRRGRRSWSATGSTRMSTSTGRSRSSSHSLLRLSLVLVSQPPQALTWPRLTASSGSHLSSSHSLLRLSLVLVSQPPQALTWPRLTASSVFLLYSSHSLSLNCFRSYFFYFHNVVFYLFSTSSFPVFSLVFFS